MNEEAPFKLWKTLADRFGDRTRIVKPRAIQDYNELRFSDFKSVAAFDERFSDIRARLNYCGESALLTEDKMIEKTLMTMHPSMHTERNNWRSKGFTSYSDLINEMTRSEVEERIVVENHEKRVVTGESHYSGVGKTANKSFRRNDRKHKPFGNQKKPDVKNLICYRCGCSGHFKANCKTATHLVDAYQRTKKDENKKLESHGIESVPSQPTPDNKPLSN